MNYVEKYSKLSNILKRKAEGYQWKKSRTFTREEISKFIIAAPDKKYLVVKVALIMGIKGVRSTFEMHSMKAEDVQDLGSAFLITIPSTQPKNDRKFTLTGNFYDICKKYVDLRPANIATPYFFLNYQYCMVRGKCTMQNIGINDFASMGKQIATFLRLPNANLYIGHCFWRSSVRLTLNAGRDVKAATKQYKGSESSMVARVSADVSGTNVMKKANNSLVSKPRPIYLAMPVTSNTHTSREASTTPLLENDMENQTQRKMIGRSIRLKKGVLPRTFYQPPGPVWNVKSASKSLIGAEPQPKKLKPATTLTGNSASGRGLTNLNTRGAEPQPKQLKPATTVTGNNASGSGLTNLNTSGNVAKPTFIVLRPQPSSQLPKLLNVCSSRLTSFAENVNETATVYPSQDGKFTGQPDQRTRSNKRKAQEDALPYIEEDALPHINEEEEEMASSECTTTDLNNTLCRICFLESNRVKSLLQSDDEETKRFHLMFESLTNTKLEVNETMPSHLCKSCEESLISSYSFRMLCLQSNDNLRNYNAISQSIKKEYEENSECLDVSPTDESVSIKSEELKILDERMDEDTSVKKECGPDIEDTTTENKCGPDIEDTATENKCGPDIEDTATENKCGPDIEDTSTENKCDPDIEVKDEEKPNLMLETNDFIDRISMSYDIETLVDCYEPDSQNACDLNSKRTEHKLPVSSCSNVPEIHHNEDFNDDSSAISQSGYGHNNSDDDESSDCNRLTTADCEEYIPVFTVALSDEKTDKNGLETPESTRVDRNDSVISDIGNKTINFSCGPKPLPEYGTLSSTRLSVAMSDEKMDKNVLDTPESTFVDRNDSVISDIEIRTINSSCDPTVKPFLLGPYYHYDGKPSARERPTLCLICYKEVEGGAHFPQHLFRYHERSKEVRRLKTMKPNSKERLTLESILQTEIINRQPVKFSKKKEYSTCIYCVGLYAKNILPLHVKHCKHKLKITESKGEYLTTSQTYLTFMHKTSRVRNEVFNIMRPDDISETAKNDPLICLYGEALLSKHEGQPILNVISYKMREMGRLLIGLRRMTKFDCLFDALKPEYFGNFISFTKEMSGYDEDSKRFGAPQLALHMVDSLKTLCDVAHKLIVENEKIHGIEWDDHERKQAEIRDMKKLIDHWSNELSSLAFQNLQVQVPKN